MRKQHFILSSIFAFSCLAVILCFTTTLHPAKAATVDELQTQINDRNAKIANLEKEIAQYQDQLTTIGKQAKNLQGNIKTLDATKAKLTKEIQVAQTQIQAANLEIQQLTIQIKDKKSEISQNEQAITESLQNIDQTESSSIILQFLTDSQLSVLLNKFESLRQFEESVHDRVETLKNLQQQLQTSVDKTEATQKKLVNLQDQLSDKKTLVEYDQQQKNKLLADTKNKESNYQKILAEKKALRDAFNKELVDFESQLKLVIDPKSVPKASTGILSWPVTKVIVTQTFGDTDFAKAHAQAYNGHGHNGIDLGVPIGTPIKAALSGVVKGTGNTDTVCPGASYGNWVMIEHPNGLSTLYAHLSVIKVSQGQQLSTGDLVGYSGQTGYATGPHLHFTVYATQGVQILKRKSAVCGGTYTMPIADLAAYLNPLSYLPSL